MISHVCDLDKIESKGIIAEKNLSQVFSMDDSNSESVIIYESSTEESKSELFTILSAQISKKILLKKQRMRNLWLQIIQSLLSRYIINYSSVVNTSWKILMPRANKSACKTQRTGTIRKCIRP